MENILLRKARSMYEEGRIVGAKTIYDAYLTGNNFNPPDLEDFIPDYIQTICRYYNLNLTETNSLYIKMDNSKQSIQNKNNNQKVLTEYEDNIKKLFVYDMSDVVHWGEHAGSKISDTLMLNPEYIIWCILNMDHFSINNRIFLMESILRQKQNIEALEVNMLKQLIIKKWGIDSDDVDCKSDCYDDGPREYGYDSKDDMTFNEAFDGDIDAWNHYNE